MSVKGLAMMDILKKLRIVLGGISVLGKNRERTQSESGIAVEGEQGRSLQLLGQLCQPLFTLLLLSFVLLMLSTGIYKMIRHKF